MLCWVAALTFLSLAAILSWEMVWVWIPVYFLAFDAWISCWASLALASRSLISVSILASSAWTVSFCFLEMRLFFWEPNLANSPYYLEIVKSASSISFWAASMFLRSSFLSVSSSSLSFSKIFLPSLHLSCFLPRALLLVWTTVCYCLTTVSYSFLASSRAFLATISTSWTYFSISLTSCSIFSASFFSSMSFCSV